MPAGVLKPGAAARAASCSDLDLPGHGPQKGQGPSRPHGASSYLQTETRRSEVTAARVTPGPPAPTPPRGPLPRSARLPLSFPTQLPNLPLPRPALSGQPAGTSQCPPPPAPSPAPQPLAWRNRGSSSTPHRPPPGPHEPGLLGAAPSHGGPAHSGLPRAQSHSSQFPLVPGKAPAPTAAMTPLGPAQG